MTLQKRDLVATGLVGFVGVIYLLWLLDLLPASLSGVRGAGTVILMLGFVASAIAVVPTFGQLLHGNLAYLITTSFIGLVAGVVMLVGSSQVALAVVMVAMITLWLMATIDHSRLSRAASRMPVDQGSPAGRSAVSV